MDSLIGSVSTGQDGGIYLHTRTDFCIDISKMQCHYYK